MSLFSVPMIAALFMGVSDFASVDFRYDCAGSDPYFCGLLNTARSSQRRATHLKGCRYSGKGCVQQYTVTACYGERKGKKALKRNKNSRQETIGLDDRAKIRAQGRWVAEPAGPNATVIAKPRGLDDNEVAEERRGGDDEQAQQ